MDELRIRGRVFRTKGDYAAGWRDDKKIEKLEQKYNLSSHEDVEALIRELESGRISFETLVGEDYYDEMVVLERDLKRRDEEAASARNSRFWGRNNRRSKDATDNSGVNRIDKKPGAVKNKGSNGEVTGGLDSYDADMQNQIIQELKRAQLRRRLLMIVLGLCVLGSVGYLGFYFFLFEKNDAEYSSLAELKVEDAGGTVVINYEEAKDKPPILKKYEQLYQKNRKLVGWITIKGCGIDYPVMQTNNNEYYLDHNFNQEYDKNGSIFMDMNCDAAFPDDNTILYGHHMKSGKMFGNLNYYSKQDFWAKNPTFTFDTIYETGEYAVMYVFRSRIYSEEEVVFKYYQFIGASGEDEFYSNMDEMASISLYDTGVVPEYGDKLVTLSTCDSSETDGRFVVVAKKIN